MGCDDDSIGYEPREGVWLDQQGKSFQGYIIFSSEYERRFFNSFQKQAVNAQKKMNKKW